MANLHILRIFSVKILTKHTLPKKPPKFQSIKTRDFEVTGHFFYVILCKILKITKKLNFFFLTKLGAQKDKVISRLVRIKYLACNTKIKSRSHQKPKINPKSEIDYRIDFLIKIWIFWPEIFCQKIGVLNRIFRDLFNSRNQFQNFPACEI